MKKHELIGEVAEVSAPETKSKQNGGGDYKIATLTIRQFDKDRSYLHMNAFNDIADLVGTFTKGELVIVQVDVVSRRNNIYWNTSVKVTSITKLPSSPTVLQPVVQPDNESGIQIEYAEAGEPEVYVPQPRVTPAPIAELDDIDKKLMEEIYASKDVSETEPEKTEVVFPSVIPQKTGSDSPNEQLIDLIQKVGTEKLAELLRKASEQ